MELSSPTKQNTFNLDSPPPQPPSTKAASKGGGFMPPPSPPSGIGDLANSPQLMTMQGLAMVKDGFQLIANGVPALSQILSNTMTDIEQEVIQALSATAAGQPPAVTAPPGVAPMMTPPPGASAPPAASMGGMAGASGGPPSPMGM
jgi:hypothetical protein